MPDPVVRSSPSLCSVPLHFMQEYVRFATVDLLDVYRPVRGLCRHIHSTPVQPARMLELLQPLVSHHPAWALPLGAGLYGWAVELSG